MLPRNEHRENPNCCSCPKPKFHYKYWFLEMERYNCLRPQEMDTHHHFPNKHNRGVRETCFLGNECLMIYSIVLELGI